MGNEHDDDIAPEVNEGAELETESYPGTTGDGETAEGNRGTVKD